MVLAGANRRWLYLLAGLVTVTSMFGFANWTGHLSKTLAPSRLNIPHVWNSHTSTLKDTLFEQVYSIEQPAAYDYSTLASVCSYKPATPDAPYLNCTEIWLGLTSMMSQVKVCLKMAVDSGSHIVLPKMARRDPAALKDFHQFDANSYRPYHEWFDDEHIIRVMERVCPHTRVIRQSDAGKTVIVKEHMEVSLSEEFFYTAGAPYFWAGHTFKDWWADHYAAARERLSEPNLEGEGITVVDIHPGFMLFKLMDDPSGNDLKQWNDLSGLLRFPIAERQIVHRLLAKIGGPFYAVHFRTENDTVWSAPVDQRRRALEGLDKAWEKFGQPGSGEKPRVYVSSGDEEQANYFVAGALEKGWTAIHKWALLEDDPDTTAMVNALAFDSMGGVDLGIMMQADFFFGLGGSAMSFTAANYRDPTGRYRGSSLDIQDDKGARNHLFWDLDNPGYPCCL